MLYYYTVYALVDCGYCVKALNKLSEHGLEHVLVLMDKCPDFRNQIKPESKVEYILTQIHPTKHAGGETCT